MRTVGVDLAADPANTALCVVDWATGTVELSPRPVTDERIVESVSSSDVAAIDVPLGWPAAFVEALVAHRDGAGWPPVDLAPPADREPLRFRATDLVARVGGAQPLSVSTDRIGVAAMRGARLQHLLRTAGVAVDRSGTTGKVVEAYPAAALRAWGLQSSRYKRAANAPARRRLIASLVPRCGRLARSAESRLERCDDDDLDAFVCAVVARAARLGMTTRPSPEQLEMARVEGWIHVPTAGPEQIASADPAVRW